ncbi:MAG: DUF2071 domain-containing protein [Pseudonocardiales bacterium]|nr:DUF2071 domain-containing protein [Pseudonocardiales bacterium]
MVWPLIYQRWQTFTFLHWAYDPGDVQRLLPSGLDVHTYDGVAWVGLTPFLLCDFRLPGFPAIPGLSTFPETNVRTYVVDRNGRDGLWFLSLDASGLATVLGARASLGVPYHWAAMTVEANSTVTYRSRRRYPPAAGHRRSLGVSATPPLTWDPREGSHRATSGQARGCPMRGPAYEPSPQVKSGVALTV